MDDSRLSFLGTEGLERIRDLRVTVVGAGGSGSHIVQQLAHLRVASIIVIDPQDLEPSNVNRVVLSHYGAVGKPKAEILRSRLRKLGTTIEPILAEIESADALAALQSADLCFGAVDHFGTRHMIEYFARAAFVPVIDVGMQITPDKATRTISSAGGQVVTSLPGAACFWCMGFLNDNLLTHERSRYANGIPAFEQQVISINGLLASQAITNMLALFAGFSGRSGITPYISYNALDSRMRPHPNLTGVDLSSCRHYPLKDAGWAAR